MAVAGWHSGPSPFIGVAVPGSSQQLSEFLVSPAQHFTGMPRHSQTIRLLQSDYAWPDGRCCILIQQSLNFNGWLYLRQGQMVMRQWCQMNQQQLNSPRAPEESHLKGFRCSLKPLAPCHVIGESCESWLPAFVFLQYCGFDILCAEGCSSEAWQAG